MAGYSVTYTVVDNATKQIDQINRRIAAMRAPMDRLSKQVSRFVDLSGLKKVGDAFGFIGNAVGTVFRTMSQLVPVFGALISAGSIAGMLKLVGTFAAFSHELQQNADAIGVSTQELQKFEDATRLAGGNTQDMIDGLKALHTASANAFVGLASPEQIAWFNRLGISFKDANGQLRQTADIMPEVIKAISDIKDPADRARASAALLGDANMKLVETFRQSHQAFGAWLTDASRYTELTDQQKQSLQEYTEAQGRLSTAFDHLGQQVSATLAHAFTPLMNHLSEFVEKHSPEIVAAVDQIATRFANWLENVDWSKVQHGIDSMIEGLKWVVNNLDTVKTVAEVIAGIFVAKWGISVVAAIAQVTSALGSLGAGASAAAAVGGVGLLGALGAVAGVAGLLAAGGVAGAMNAPMVDDQGRQVGTWGGKPQEAPTSKVPNDQLITGKTILQHIGRWFGIGTAPSTAPGTVPSDAISPEVTPQGQALLSQIAGGESKGDPTVLYGGGHISDTSKFPQWSGAMTPYGMTHAAGRYQFQPGTWETASAATGVKDFSPASQDKNAWWLAQHDYHARTGRNLATDLKDPSKAQEIGSALGPTWTSANAGKWANDLQTKLAAVPKPAAPTAVAALPTPSAPQAAVPQAAPPVNGSVDVSITHKNPPPNSAVTATGSGAVNVAPPRVEHQDMASI